MNKYKKELEIAKKLARQAGEIMLKYFRNRDAGAETKKDQTIVTLADKDINSLVISVLNKETPGYSIWGEEESSILDDSEFTWVCDPVDGTMPFAKGIPISTFSLALVDSEGNSVLGVVYDPFTDRLYEAVKGQGAFVNGEKMIVSAKADFKTAYIDSELWINHEEGVMFDDPKDIFSKLDAKVTTQCSAIIMGCMVASGDYDAMIFGQGKPEDIAALSVIVTEAGGKVTDLFGNEQRYDRNIIGAVVSNGSLHDDICKITRNINYTSKYLK